MYGDTAYRQGGSGVPALVLLVKIEILNVHIQVVVDAKSHDPLDVHVLCVSGMDRLPVDLEVDLVRVLLRVDLEKVAGLPCASPFFTAGCAVQPLEMSVVVSPSRRLIR